MTAEDGHQQVSSEQRHVEMKAGNAEEDNHCEDEVNCVGLNERTALIREKVGGLSVVVTSVFLVGEMAGGGVLALPMAIVNSGWIGLLMILASCVASGYNGMFLGNCWNILQTRYPEYRDHVSSPFATIAERAVGKWMRHVITFCVLFSLFGACTVFLLVSAQNIQSLLAEAHVSVSFCYWLLIITGALIPLTWFGTPKDFWPVGIGACFATSTACVLIFVAMMLDLSTEGHEVSHSSPTFISLCLSFAAMQFAFGGAVVFPTIQQDMKEPAKFYKSVIIAYIVLLLMYLPVAAGGYFVYGDSIHNNILQSLPEGALRITSEILITAHLILAVIICLNPIAQHFEGLFGIKNNFNWKRCLLRVAIMTLALFTAESIPHFGALLNLVGASTVIFTTFIAPSLFYLRLCSKKGDWQPQELPLHIRVLAVEMMLVGLFGGVAATYAAIVDMISSSTFILPCYVNMTAANS